MYSRDRIKSATGRAQKSLSARLSGAFSLGRALLTCDGKKTRPRIASLNWRIENNRAIPREERKKRGRGEGGEREERSRRRRRRTRTRKGTGDEESTASARLTEAVSLRFIAWPRKEKNVSGPTGPSFLPLCAFSSRCRLPSSSWMSIYYRARPCGSLPGRALDLTPRLVKHRFHAAEKQFNSLVSLFSREPPRPPNHLATPPNLPHRMFPNLYAPRTRTLSTSLAYDLVYY